MSRSALEAHTDEFAERNLFLMAILGLVSAKHKLADLVERHAPAVGAERVNPAHPFLLMLLGLTRLARSVHEHVLTLSAEVDPRASRVEDGESPWLRRMLK